MSDDNTKVEIEISELNALKDKAKSVDSLKTKVSEWETKYNTLTADHEALKKEKTPKNAPNREEIEQELRTQFKTELDAVIADRDKAKSALKKHTVTNKVLQEMERIGLDPDVRDLVAQNIADRCDLDGEDFETAKLRIKSPTGETMWSRKKTDEMMGASEFAEMFAQERPSLFTKKKKQGVNSNYDGRNGAGEGGQGSGGGNGSGEYSELTVEQFREMSQEEINALPDAVFEKFSSTVEIVG